MNKKEWEELQGLINDVLAIVTLVTQDGTGYLNPTPPFRVFRIFFSLNVTALILFVFITANVNTKHSWWISSAVVGWTWSGFGLLPRVLQTESNPAIAISVRLGLCLFIPLSLSLSSWQKATGSRCQLPREQHERCRKWLPIPSHFLRSGPWLLVLDGALPELHAINMH